jgi:D-tyrosyl-tRNA(Tyr) deacylase
VLGREGPIGDDYRRPAMRAVVQRVLRAQVRVADQVIGAIGPGLCVFVGVTHADTVEEARKLASKLWHLRVMDDEAGVMNRAVADGSRALLVVSQFTLYGDTAAGRRPSWMAAARPEQAAPLVEEVVQALRGLGAEVATGRFRAEMEVELVNDGPVTVLVEVNPAPAPPGSPPVRAVGRAGGATASPSQQQ